MSPIHVLLANEPRSYRDAMATALRVLRPRARVRAVEPDQLDGEVARHHPELVVCSELTPTVRAEALAWVLLYPDGARLAIRHVGDAEDTAGDLDLADLVDVVDRTEALACDRAASHLK